MNVPSDAAILGATASGKTALAMEIARAEPGYQSPQYFGDTPSIMREER